jgi:hypothetical protein
MLEKNEIFRGKSFKKLFFQEILWNFPRKKMYEKSAPGHPVPAARGLNGVFGLGQARVAAIFLQPLSVLRPVKSVFLQVRDWTSE